MAKETYIGNHDENMTPLPPHEDPTPETKLTRNLLLRPSFIVNFPILKPASSIYDLAPHVIVLACDLENLSCFTSYEKLKRYYAVMIHNYIAQTRAKIVLVTPPPQPLKAYRSKLVASAISEIGLIHVVGLADVNQAINLWAGDWMTLYQDESTPDATFYNLYMTSTGQEIRSDTIYKANIHDCFYILLLPQVVVADGVVNCLLDLRFLRRKHDLKNA